MNNNEASEKISSFGLQPYCGNCNIDCNLCSQYNIVVEEYDVDGCISQIGAFRKWEMDFIDRVLGHYSNWRDKSFKILSYDEDADIVHVRIQCTDQNCNCIGAWEVEV
jgi:hypothetical protein